MKECQIVVIGSRKAGKSAFIIEFVYEGYVDETIEDAYRKLVKIDNSQVVLDIKDSVDEEFSAMREQNMYTGQGFILVYSITSLSSFNDLDHARKQILRVKDKDDVPIVLVGNKCEKEHKRQVTRNQGEDLARQWQCSFYECSVKEKINVSEVFYDAARQILHHPDYIKHYAEEEQREYQATKALAEEKKRRHKQAYKRAIKDKFSLNIRAAHFNHIGLPRSGKSSFQRRMMGEILNLCDAKEKGEDFQPSTGIAEAKGQIFIHSMSTDLGTIQGKVWTSVKGVKEEANMLNQCIYQAVHHDTSAASSRYQNPVLSVSSNAQQSASSIIAAMPARRSAPKTKWEKFRSLFNRSPGTKAPSKKDMQETFEIIDNVMENKEWEDVKYMLNDMILLINTDTGGQAEFLDLQASLVLGPSLNFLYRRLVDELDKQYETYFTGQDGVSTEKISSTNTVEDVLFQALAGIACLGGSSLESDGKQTRPSQSKAIFVGTHRDLILPEELKKKDKLFQQKVENTEFYDKNIIEFASEDQMMIAVDNMRGDQKEIEEIRVLLENIIMRTFDPIAIPAAWLMLSLLIRKTGVCTMSLRECEELAAKLRISPSELQDALWFLHHHIGVLLYYPEIESLKYTVICDIQIVFDSASNLIKNTFTFEMVGRQRSAIFRERGQFTLKDLKKAASGNTNNLLSLEKLVDLLKDRNVLTVMPSLSCATTEETTYFMPSILHSASPEELLSHSKSSDSDPAPLMLRYDCGYFPIGVFPAMIANLVSQQKEDWMMITKGLCKNRVQFRVGKDFDIVTLISHPRFLEVAISRRERFLTPLGALCCHVRDAVQFTLDEATSHLNYHFRMGYKFGFLCPIHPETPRHHISVVTGESAINMECPEDETQPIPLEPSHKVWFSAISNNPPQPKAYQATEGLRQSSKLLPQFNIEEVTSSPQLNVEDHSAVTSVQQLNIDDLYTVTSLLGDLLDENLLELGLALGLLYPKMRRMRHLIGDMVAAWLNVEDNVLKASGPPSWASLIKALKEIGQHGIAHNIEQAHGSSIQAP